MCFSKTIWVVFLSEKKKKNNEEFFSNYEKIAPRSGRRNEQTVEPDGRTDKINPFHGRLSLFVLFEHFLHSLHTFCTLFAHSFMATFCADEYFMQKYQTLM